MNVRLELAHKKAKVKKVLLKSDTIIGRSTECGLRIASNEVSRQHCKICIGEDGVTVRDLGSSNGTFVNGYQLEPETDYEIAPDSELSLGGIKFFVRFSESAAKAMQTDGLGSTVDLKPHQHEALAETAALGFADTATSEEAPDDEMEFAEADAELEEAADETPAEAQADGEAGTVQMVWAADLDSSDAAESDEEIIADDDSATLEDEASEPASAAAEPEPAEEPAITDDEVVHLDLDEPEAAVEQEDEVFGLEFDEPEIDEVEEVVDLELEESEVAAVEEVVDRELEEESGEDQQAGGAAESETEAEPAMETADVVFEEDENEDSEDVVFEADEEFDEDEPVREESPQTPAPEEAELEVAELEKVEEIEEEPELSGIEETVEEEMDEDDVAAFLNQVAEEDSGASNDDEGLGDFFKQFEN